MQRVHLAQTIRHRFLGRLVALKIHLHRALVVRGRRVKSRPRGDDPDHQQRVLRRVSEPLEAFALPRVVDEHFRRERSLFVSAERGGDVVLRRGLRRRATAFGDDLRRDARSFLCRALHGGARARDGGARGREGDERGHRARRGVRISASQRRASGALRRRRER